MKTASNIMLCGYIFLVANMITEITTSLPTGSSSFTTTLTTAATPTTTLSLTSSTTTITTTATTTTTTMTSKSDNYTVQVNCLNGGMYNGFTCVCTAMFFGTMCELIGTGNRFYVGRTTNLTVNVVYRIVNVEFRSELADTFSQHYKDFVKDHQSKTMQIFQSIPGIKDTVVHSLSEGSVIVNYSVIVEADYREDMSIFSQYSMIFDYVEQTLKEFAQKNCNENSTYCIDHDIYTSAQYPLSEHETCYRLIPHGFRDWYEPVITRDGLYCVNECDTSSHNYLNCNHGNCHVQSTGSQCFCPDTDIYLYTSSRCTGRILLVALYGGVGGALGVLLISIAIMTIFLCRRRRHTDTNLYEDIK